MSSIVSCRKFSPKYRCLGSKRTHKKQVYFDLSLFACLGSLFGTPRVKLLIGNVWLIGTSDSKWKATLIYCLVKRFEFFFYFAFFVFWFSRSFYVCRTFELWKSFWKVLKGSKYFYHDFDENLDNNYWYVVLDLKAWTIKLGR